MDENIKEAKKKLKELTNSNIIALKEITNYINKVEDGNFLDKIKNDNAIFKTVKPHGVQAGQGFIYLPKQWIGKNIRVEEVK